MRRLLGFRVHNDTSLRVVYRPHQAAGHPLKVQQLSRRSAVTPQTAPSGTLRCKPCWSPQSRTTSICWGCRRRRWRGCSRSGCGSCRRRICKMPPCDVTNTLSRSRIQSADARFGAVLTNFFSLALRLWRDSCFLRKKRAAFCCHEAFSWSVNFTTACFSRIRQPRAS